MKNPWMSVWLSAANSVTAAARGQIAAQAKRNQTAMLTEMQRQAFAFWAPALQPAPVKRESRKRSQRG